MDLTVIIVTYNSAQQLGDCAATLGPALGRAAAQVVVVDNASTDGSAEAAARLWPSACIVRHAVNRGFAAAVNKGLAVATGRAVLLLNPDARPAVGLMPALLTHLDRDPRAGIIAPRLIDETGRAVLSCYPFLSPATVAWRHLQLSRLLPNHGLGRYRRLTLAPGQTEPLTVPWAQGACLLLRRAMLDEIGPLDERFVLYCEEVDLCRRAANAGWRTVYVPSVTVRHAEGSSARQVVPLKLASHYFSKVLYFEKHHPGAQALSVRLLLLLDLALRSLYRAVGVLRRHPPDAGLRLRTYGLIARRLLATPPDRLQADWLAMAADQAPRSATSPQRTSL